MSKNSQQLDPFIGMTEIASALENSGFSPILVGGIALVLLGSQRVTRDIDFVVKQPDDKLAELVGLFYDRGFELISKLNNRGETLSTIDNRTVAKIRLELDRPDSALFLNPTTKVRIDLLFDFPISAAELAKDAANLKIAGQRLRVASQASLLQLKKIALASRNKPGDAEDIAFLEGLKKQSFDDL